MSRAATVLARGPAALAGAGLAVAAAALAAGLGYGGGARRTRLPGLPEPDGVAPWLLPATRLCMIVAAVATVGFLLAATVLSPMHARVASHRTVGPSTRRGLSDVAARRLTVAGWSAMAWVGTAVAASWLSAVDSAGRSRSMPQVVTFATGTTTGRALAAVAILAALLALACRTVDTPAGAVATLALAVATVLPPVFAGHAVSGRYPHFAASGILLHVVAAVLWAGGLLALAVSARGPAAQLAVAVDRFSALAVGCFTVVAVSGVLSAWVHLPDLGSLFSSTYGRLVLTKVVVLAMIGGIGWWHRRSTMPALRAGRRRTFLRLAGVEVLLFGAVLGTATALSRTAPPNPMAGGHAGHAMPAGYLLLGYPLPPAPTVENLLAWWLPEPLFVMVGVGLAGLYLAGVWRLRRDGRRWPVGRVLAMAVGSGILIAATSTGFARYAPVLLSAHAVRHLLVVAVVPLLLVVAAPIELARRVFARPADAWPGPADWIGATLRSRVNRLLTNPVGVGALFAGGLALVYLGGLYEVTVRIPAVHLAVLTGGLLVGCLYYALAMDAGPARGRISRRGRVILLMAGMVGYAGTGVLLLTRDASVAADWFTALARTWAPIAGADEHRAGLIILIASVLPLSVMAAALRVRTQDRPEPPAVGSQPRVSIQPAAWQMASSSVSRPDHPAPDARRRPMTRPLRHVEPDVAGDARSRMRRHTIHR